MGNLSRSSTFLCDGTWDHLRGSSPRVGLRANGDGVAHSSRGSNDPPGRAGSPLTARRSTSDLMVGSCEVRVMRNAETVLNISIWSDRSELVERLLAQRCELCGATEQIEVHPIRKLADVEQKGHAERPRWMRIMAARQRKTLIVCQKCHHDIQYGRYDGRALAEIGHRRAT